MPFLLYFSAEHSLGDIDNIQMAFDAVWQPRANIKLYGIWFIDEWAVIRTFSKPDRNWFAWQAGFDGSSLFRQGDLLLLEASWTDYRVYRHRFRINTLENRGYSMGHWMGPHAQSLHATYLLPLANLKLLTDYTYVKRGALTDEMLSDQYRLPPFGNAQQFPRFSGNTESRHALSLSAIYPLWRELLLQVELEMIQWSNPEFNPAKPDIPGTVDNITKTSINLALHYNFDMPGGLLSLVRR